MKSHNSLKLLYSIPQTSTFTTGPTQYGAESPQLQFDIHVGLKTHKIDYNATVNQ